MKEVGTSLARRVAALFEDLREHEKTAPGEVDQIIVAITAHLRSWRPESVSPLGTLPDPEAPAVDPRVAQ